MTNWIIASSWPNRSLWMLPGVVQGAGIFDYGEDDEIGRLSSFIIVSTKYSSSVLLRRGKEVVSHWKGWCGVWSRLFAAFEDRTKARIQECKSTVREKETKQDLIRPRGSVPLLGHDNTLSASRSKSSTKKEERILAQVS